MTPIDAIRALSAIISANDNVENTTRLYLINLISRAMLNLAEWDMCKDIVRKSGIELDVVTEVNEIKPDDWCGFKGGICKTKKKKLLSRNSLKTVYGNS